MVKSTRTSLKSTKPKYPIYIISKGRWESRLTSWTLEEMKVDYKIVVEPQEYKQYASVIDPKKILVLPFSNLGQGSIPARNFVWEHSIQQGAERHWILDDNIRYFYRLNRNSKNRCMTGVCFTAIEDFVDRYKNVGIAGMQYHTFAVEKQKQKPFAMNTRIYSCILLNNTVDFRWRGRYNEDTDLSIRILKAGWCSILFYAFLAGKNATLKMKGGNTDELYKGDGRLLMAESLRQQHPDIVTISYKWGRPQHQVDYRGFKRNRLIKKENLIVPRGTNDYGMKLVKNRRLNVKTK